ncbi:MAG: hypothetical protein ABJX94_10390 [Flavobacteriaceae bacterium]
MINIFTVTTKELNLIAPWRNGNLIPNGIMLWNIHSSEVKLYFSFKLAS